MSNINIRLVGTSNLGPINKDIEATTARVKALNAAFAQASKLQLQNAMGGTIPSAHPNTKFINEFRTAMEAQRAAFTDSVTAMGDFRVRSIRLADGIDVLTERINKNKVGLREFGRELRSGGIDKIARQQIANRRSLLMEWGKNADGSRDAQILTPDRSGIRVWSDYRTAAGAYNKVISSVAANTVNWGKNTQWAGRQITAGFTMPLMMATAATGKLAYDMDKGLTQVVKVYGDAATELTTTDQMIKDSVTATARNMAQAYGQSGNDTIEIAGQLAAVGKTGKELTEATAEVTRARILGEVDLQDAMKQTITLQSVWNMNSKELADSFNYMNMMENQTVLTMQDFSIGIPKVAGIIKSLNGDVQEAGTLLAAMKAGGIDAAEGATAVKSIAFKVMAPTNAALKDFTEKTGQNYLEIVEGTDSVVGRLELLGEAIQNLDMEDKTGLIQKMFGLHQGSKALTIIEQLASGSEQMTRAFEVARASSEEWADTAARELEKLTGSDWQRFQQQLEALKMTLAEFGTSALQAATPVLKFLDDMFQWLMNLPEGIKSFAKAAALFFAALGPLMMMVGIGANALASTVVGLSTLLGVFLKRNQLMTAEQVIQDRRAETASSKAMARNEKMGVSYNKLASQINRVTAALERQILLQTQGAGALPIISAGAIGGTYIGKHSPTGIAATQAAAQDAYVPRHAAAPTAASLVGPVANGPALMAAASAAAAKNTQQTANNVNRMNAGAKVFGGLMAVSMVGALADSDSMLGKVSQMAFMASMAGSAFSMLGGGKLLAGPMAKIGASAAGAAASMAKFAPAISAAAGPLGVFALAAGGSFLFVKKKIDESVEGMKELNNSGKVWADIIGFTFTEAGERVDLTGEKIRSLQSDVMRFKEEQVEAAKELATYEDASLDRQVQAAVWQGVQAFNAGATNEQAREAVKIALKAINRELSEADIEDLIVDVRFRNTSDTIEHVIEQMQSDMERATNHDFEMSWWEKFVRVEGAFVGYDLSYKAIEAIKGNAKAAAEVWLNSSIEEQPKVLGQIQDALLVEQDRLFAELRANNEKQFKELGIVDWESMVSLDPYTLGSILSTDEYKAILNYQEQQKIFMEEMLTILRIKIPKGGIMDLQQFRNLIYTQEHLQHAVANTKMETVGIDEAQKRYNEALRWGAMGGKNLSEAEKLVTLNAFRAAEGLDKATHSTQLFTQAVRGAQAAASKPWIPADAFKNLPKASDFNAYTLRDHGFEATEEDAQRIADMYKSTMEEAQGDLFSISDTAMSNAIQAQDRYIQRANERASDALSKRHERQTEALAARQEAAQEAFESRRERWQARWEGIMDNFEKKNEARRKSIEDSYDARINKIEQTIEVEQNAEDIRKKIFEAERTRLSRLANMANKSIDFNVALNTGDLDSAARISNDMFSTQESWLIDDAEEAAGEAWDKRKSALQKEIDALKDGKDAALEKIKAIEKAEKEALEEKKKREEKALDNERKALNKSLEQQRKRLQEGQRAEQKALADQQRDAADFRAQEQARHRLALDAQLAALRAHVPRNQKELDKQMRDIQAAYDDYGKKLGIKGDVWAGVVGTALETRIDNANLKMANETKWRRMGEVIAANIVKGGLGISLDELFKWIAGGPPPKGLKAPKKLTFDSAGNARIPGATYVRHSGGIIGPNANGKRTGISGNSLSPSEVPVTALIGEAVLNRNATKYLGHDLIYKLNRGEKVAPDAMGGPDFGVANWPGANIVQILMAALMYKATEQAMAAALLNPANFTDAVSSEYGLVGGMGPSTGPVYPGGWTRPASGRISSRYGWRIHPITGTRRMHNGTDIAAPMGAPIYAAKGGRVTMAHFSGGRGNLTQIDHGGGLATGYAHQSRFLVRPGDRVRTGQRIGSIGSTGASTGPHLHFEHYVNGRYAPPGRIIPGLMKGGYTMSDGLAQLHKNETVLTAPLSEKLKIGIDNFAESGPQLTIDMRGAIIYGVDDLDAKMEGAVNKALSKRENKIGRKRVIR